MKLNNEYKRQVYKLMDSAGMPRSNASSFGNLTKFETWQKIEIHCRIKTAYKIQERIDNWKVCPSPKLEPENCWTATLEEVTECQGSQVSIQVFEPISKPAIKEFDLNEYSPKADYSLDDLLAELEDTGYAPKLITGQVESIDFSQFEGMSSTPATIAEEEEEGEGEVQRWYQKPAAIAEEEEEGEGEVQRWYQKPAAIAGMIIALFFVSMGLTIGYRTIKGEQTPGVEVGEIRATN